MALGDLECVKIDSAIDNLRHRKEAYLSIKGWHHTSSTVDCCWRWFKEIDGKYYGCGTDDAFKIQSTLDLQEYANEHPSEFED